MNPTQTYLNG